MYRSYRSRIRRLYIPRGEAWTTPDAVGAALWVPPGDPKRRLREGLFEAAVDAAWHRLRAAPAGGCESRS